MMKVMRKKKNKKHLETFFFIKIYNKCAIYTSTLTIKAEMCLISYFTVSLKKKKMFSTEMNLIYNSFIQQSFITGLV